MSLIMEAWRQRGYAPDGEEHLLKEYEDKLQLEANKRDLMSALRASPAPDANFETAPAVGGRWATVAENNPSRSSKWDATPEYNSIILNAYSQARQNEYGNAGGRIENYLTPVRADVVDGRILINPKDPSVPRVNLPNNVGAKGVSPSSPSFHDYDVKTPGGQVRPDRVGTGISTYPVPGGGAPATPSGTVNNAGEIFTAGNKNMVRSFAIPTPDASRYTDITVNYTVSGQHGLDEGFVIRYGEIQPDGSVILRTYGEGDNWRQAPPLKFYWGKEVDGVWQENQREILRKIK